MDTPAPSSKREILACAEQGVTRRRQAEVDDLALLLAWADVHSGDPQAEPGAVPITHGGPKLVALGGEGTPDIEDLCFSEIAVARRVGEVATRHALADGLDLRHRLPRFWTRVQELSCEVWVARRVATLSRKLSKKAVAHVDAEVAAVAESSPYRILAAAEAAIIAADPDAHRDRIQQNEQKQGVWFPRPRVGEEVDDLDPSAGIRSVYGRIDTADAADLEAAVEAVAAALEAHGDHDPENPPTRDQLRAQALGLLSRPEDALELLNGPPEEGTDEREGLDTLAGGSRYTGGSSLASGTRPPSDRYSTTSTCQPRPRRESARIFAHLSLTDLLALRATGLAKVDSLGPMLLEQLAKLLRHRDVTVTPVIDLHATRAIDGYVHPDDVKLRTLLRNHGTDVFPHATGRPGVRVDHDHPTPYNPAGPPGQTGDHNDAPLTRRHHRAKTHAGYRCDQLALGVYRWITPHGLARLVTPHGTRPIDLITNPDGQPVGEIYHPPPGVRVELDIDPSAGAGQPGGTF